MEIQQLQKSVEELLNHLKVIEKIQKDSNREITMWRTRYIDSKGFLPSEKDDEYKFTSYLMATPAGIDDIQDWEKSLDDYLKDL